MTEFKAALRKAMLDTVHAEKADGTVAMSKDCFRANVRPPSQFLAGAPRGTNAQYYYCQLFDEVLNDLAAVNPEIRRFVRR